MTITELHPPTSVSTRWQPARAGIVNIWRYYDETFEFHNGRLLLRGPNGTGKSKALEVLLPYLFDASLRANRLSTFGSSDRTMHWNLMGDGHTGTTRVGYVWLEFRRGDERFTCGARLQASSHTTTVTPTYFTTGQHDLFLLTESGQPLTAAALVDAVGNAGEVHDNAASYRTAVRRTLFPGLSEQRYEALITALLQLRTPKLSERLDPALLSTLLSRALPPLAEAEISEIAEGFERLDRQREQLKALDDEVAAAESIATRQRGYARRVLRAAAAALISATSEMDGQTRKARESANALANAEAAQRIDAVAEAAARSTATGLDAQISGLKSRDAYREKGNLDELRTQKHAAAKRAEQADTKASTLAAAAATARGEADAARSAADQLSTLADAAWAEARSAADRAGLVGLHDRLSGAELQPARQLLRATVEARQTNIRAVREALTKHAAAIDRRDTAEEERDASAAELDAAIDERGAAQRDYDAERDRLADQLADWLSSCTELPTVDLEALTSAVASEVAVLSLVNSARGTAEAEYVTRETELRADRDAQVDERDGIAAERERLRDEADLPPPVPHTRTTDRSTMDGAPLWRLVAFRRDVSPIAQAGIEAALEASGLLDAWMLSDGQLTVDGHDVFAAPVAPAPGRSLATVLAPEPDGPVPAERVIALLRAIALDGDHDVVVGTDGSFRLATLHGSWEKRQAEHIGATARQHARRRRIAELDGDIARLDESIGHIDRQLAEIGHRRSALAADLDRRPQHDKLNHLAGRLRTADAEISSCQSAVARHTERVRRGQSAVAAALRALTAVGAEHGLPTDDAALDGIEAALGAARSTADLWLDQRAARDQAGKTASDKAHTADHAAGLADDEAEAAESAREEANRLARKFDAINSTIGVELREILAEMDRLQAQLTEAEETATRLQRSQFERNGEIGRLQTQCSVDEQKRTASIGVRDGATTRLRHLGSGRFLADAGLDLEIPDGVRPTLDAARKIATTLDTTPHTVGNIRDAEHRLAEVLHEAQDRLGGRADLALEPDEDIQIFVATMNGVRIGAAALREALRSERDRSQADITGAERTLFDKTLTGDTRRHLAARIRQATEMVDAMNARLERVRTASNVAVRLVWQVDPQLPVGTREARDLLLRDPIHLSDGDREALHRFFRDRIDEARAADIARSWEQQLFDVLDYTAWHRFTVKLDRADGRGWQPLTKKLHGALSGGEKAIALHLPLFAAVAAHYESVPEAPRLILLDEVFVGVDAANRGQVFELLASLDLDLVLTSDHEWCTYAELDGIAIHQLITGTDGDSAVTTARFTWDGHELVPDDSE